MPVDVVLFEPEIPPNTGNIIRLCANTGARLHLIRPLGFRLDAKAVRRAGLDYRELADVREYADCKPASTRLGQPRWFAFTTRGTLRHDEAQLCGRATRWSSARRPAACPATCWSGVRASAGCASRCSPGARSLNLSNAVAVAVYEAWRQPAWQATTPSRP